MKPSNDLIERRGLTRRDTLALTGRLIAGFMFLDVLDGCNTPTRSQTSTPLATRQTLFFSSNRAGTFNLFAKDLPSGQTVNITPGMRNVMNAQPSKNGDTFVFWSDESGTSQIYSLDVASRHIRQLTQGAPAYDPVFWRGDTRILFKMANADGNFGHVWSMGNDGSAPTDLTPHLPATWEAWKPAPVNDRHVLITIRKQQGDPKTDDLYLLDADTGSLQQLTDNATPDWFPAPHPTDSSMFAFVTKQSDDGPDVIATMNLNTGQSTIVSPPSSYDTDDPFWCADGRIACIRRLGTYAVVAFQPGGNLQVLDQAAGNDLSPAIIARS